MQIATERSSEVSSGGEYVVTQQQWAVGPGWKLVLHMIQVDAGNVLKRANLPGDLFAQPRPTVSTAQLYRFWRALEEESSDPAVAVRICETLSADAFDPAIFAALCSDNFNTAIERLARFKALLGPIKLISEVGEAETTLEVSGLHSEEVPPDSIVMMEIGFLIKLARLGTREPISPLFIQSPVRPQSPEFERFFGAPVHRGNPIRLKFSAEDAARPFLTARPQMWEMFEPELRKRLADLHETASTSQRVFSALLELLPSGESSISAVAKRLGVSTRTLQRRLQAEGEVYQSLLNGTRERLATYYLKNTSMTGSEIAYLLGFEDPNSFFRAYQAWTGTTTERVRGTAFN